MDEISGDVLDLSIRLHRELGPGLLESVYETVLAAKIADLGYSVERQKPVDIIFEGLTFDNAFRIDVLVEGRLLLEIKSVERLNAAHAKQLLTYLRPYKAATGPADQFRRRNAEGGIPEIGERLRRLCVSASSREPILRTQMIGRPWPRGDFAASPSNRRWTSTSRSPASRSTR